MELKKASKKQIKLKIALNGPSGSGKTTSALLIAFGITNDWSKIAVIDSENRSSELYVGKKLNDIVIGEFQTIQLSAPFSPERYIEAITICEKESSIECFIIDSMSHEWEGSGGILSIADQMTGNSFTNWSKITPRHNKFIETIIHANKHCVATFRSKQDYVLNEKNGKQVPEKVGLKAVTREGVDYEFTLCFDLDIKHNATASKDRTGLFMDKPQFIPTINDGLILKQWCENGVDEQKELSILLESALKECETITTEVLRIEVWNKYPLLKENETFKTEIAKKGAEIRKEIEEKLTPKQ